MRYSEEQSADCRALAASDAEAIRYFKEAIGNGRHWYLALLEAMGRWGSAAKEHEGRTYRYLIHGEAFDWLLLAERLCGEADGLLPAEEKKTLLFHGRPPLDLSPEEVEGFIGASKYRQYLNYFYGITVERALVLTVEEEVEKERGVALCRRDTDTCGEVYLRIYGSTRAALLERFRSETGYARSRSISLTELKEFTYWLFKHRLAWCDKAKVASDTKKGLERLKRQWARHGHFGVLASEEVFTSKPR